VVYVSSAAGQIAQPSNSAYGASKAAANQMIQQFSNDNAGTGNVFQTFHPGVIYTGFSGAVVPKEAFDWEDGKHSSHRVQAGRSKTREFPR